MAFANNKGFQPWPLIYLLYPLVLIALAVISRGLYKKDKFRGARGVSAIPIGFFIVIGAAHLDTQVPRLQAARVDAQYERVHAAQMLEMEQAEKAAHLAKYPEGPFTEKYGNGRKKAEGHYNAAGYKEGLVTTWYDNGQMWRETTYREDGAMESETIWFEDGTKMPSAIMQP